MLKSNKRIEIVRSNVAGLSSMSLESCDSVLSVLAKHYVRVRVTNVDSLPELEALVARKPDLVFLGMEFISSNPVLGRDDPVKIWVADYLDENGIAYTGSGRAAHQLGRDKALAKQRVLAAGLKTPAFRVIKQSQLPLGDDQSLSFPLFIKPTNRGGGLGIDSDSVAYSFVQLRTKTSSIAESLKADSLVEEYLPGREFSVAILKKESSAEFLVMPIELIAPPDTQGVRILSGKVKSSNSEKAVKVTDKVIKAKVVELAVAVFRALGARDYGRIDIRLDKYGTAHFLEANLIPSLISGYGSFPKACVLNPGLDYESMILRIVSLGLGRKAAAEENELSPSTASNYAFPPLVAAPEAF